MIKITFYLRVLPILALLVFSTYAAKAQVSKTGPDTSLYLVEMLDGSVFLGKITEKDSSVIKLKTENVGVVTLERKKIKKMEEVAPTSIHKGKYWFPNTNATRYLIGPSAFGLKQGEGYYQNTMVFLNSVNVGITDYFSIGGGFDILTLIYGNPLFYIAPKVAFPVAKNFQAGAGLLYANVVCKNCDWEGVGLGYGVVTYGTIENNATLGLVYGFVEGDLIRNPIITLSGMARASERLGFVTENWFIPPTYDNGPYTSFLSGGIRIMSERNTLDIALLTFEDIRSEGIPAIPFVDLVVKF